MCVCGKRGIAMEQTGADWFEMVMSLVLVFVLVLVFLFFFFCLRKVMSSIRLGRGCCGRV